MGCGCNLGGCGWIWWGGNPVEKQHITAEKHTPVLTILSSPTGGLGCPPYPRLGAPR